jgi:hypothetical protein
MKGRQYQNTVEEKTAVVGIGRGQGVGERNGPNNVFTSESMNKKILKTEYQ